MKTNTQTFEDILKNTVTPWGEVGYITYKRTYSRRLKEDDPTSPTEEFPQTVKRVVEACRTQLKVGFTEEEEKEFAQDLLSLKGSVAGRFWWQLGTRTVKQLGLLSLQNCAYTTINHPVDPFVWAMDALMLGSGVGFSIQREHVYQMPKVKSKIKIERKDTNDADYIVPDSREGWVKLLGRVLKAHFYGGQGFSYSTICIRGKGAPIKGFGGTASGPEELCWGINEIHKILNSRAGQKLRPIDCLDIMNIIGAVVVAGNVRRSALICIGDSDDLDYLKAKRWDLGTIPNWRSMSNNSVYCADPSKLPNEFWETYQQGEPYGLINIDLARKVGRLGETQYPDNCVGFNPCQPEFATVLTKEGVRQFKDIQIGTEIWSKEGWTKVINKWSTGIKPVNAYHTTGGVFVGTSNHRVDTRDGKVEVRYADAILTISAPYCPVEEQIPPDTYTPVERVEYLGEHEVFDITVDNQSHTYWTGGLSVSNCAEQGLADFETCVTGDTRIQTELGSFKIRDLVGKKVKVFNGENWSETTPFIAKNNDEFLRIRFSDGSYLDATKYHEFSASVPTNKRVFKKLRADQLKAGMYLPKFELGQVQGLSTEWAYTLGAFAGDGYLDAGKPVLCAVEDVYEQLFNNSKVRSANRMWKAEERLKYMYRAPIDTGNIEQEVWVQLRDSSAGLPDIIMSLDKKSSLDFLAGWIDTDGSIRNKLSNGEGFVICGSELKIRDAQLLCRRAGINYATVRRMSAAGERTNYGIRNRDIWGLQIPTFECKEINTILKRIQNFGDRYKKNNAYAESALIDTAPRQRIVSIEPIEEKQASYCFSEPIRHMGVFGNVLTYQCCLSEIFLPNVDSKEELFRVARNLYRVNKHSLRLGCHLKQTEEIVHKNMRMGIGVTGVWQATDEQRGWLSDCYEYLREYDIEYSDVNGWPVSIKLTTTKPSGTLSLLAGVTPGAHPSPAGPYYIRRIRMAADSPLVALCRKNGYDVEYQRNFDKSNDKTTMVVSFPCSVPESTPIGGNISAITQLEMVKYMQTVWSDNAVSVTVYYRLDELDEIRAWLAENYAEGLKTVSFLLYHGHGFDQAPYETITKEAYETMKAKVTPITALSFVSEDSMEIEDCATGACPIK